MKATLIVRFVLVLLLTVLISLAPSVTRATGGLSGTWSPTGSMSTGRCCHTATLLPNGQVLVAGGVGGSGILASAELYNPTTGTWTATGSMTTARYDHTATLLPNGKVLVAGGVGGSATLASAELYDPTTGTWTPTASMNIARYGHTATLLPNGKVLVVGGVYNGYVGTGAELYDPSTGTWMAAGSPIDLFAVNHTATLLPNGQVLAAGGLFEPCTPNCTTTAGASLYDTIANTWLPSAHMTYARSNHTATLLTDGQVLVAGGVGGSATLASAELYDASSGTWSPTGSMSTQRTDHTATLLPDGQVLVAGGYSDGIGDLASAELYTSYIETTTSLGSSANPAIVGQQVTYTAAVNPVPDGGTVAFSDGGAPIRGCGAQSVNTTTGTATCTVSYSSVGSHTIAAAYSGDSTYQASTAGLLTRLVQYGVTLVYKLPTSAKSGRTVPIELQLVDAAGHNLSSASLAVQALCVVPQGTPTCAGAVISYTNQSFTYVATILGYQFNVKTAGLAIGHTYQLLFRAAGEDPSTYHADANAMFTITK